MSETSIPIRVFLKRFDAGEYNGPDVHTQIRAGWVDWFCEDESLHKKTKTLVKKLKGVVDSPLINQDTMYVWFRNRCAGVEHFYDDIRIADLETDDPLYTIIPKSGFKEDEGKALVFKINNDVPIGEPRKVETVVEGRWKDVVTYFKNGGN